MMSKTIDSIYLHVAMESESRFFKAELGITDKDEFKFEGQIPHSKTYKKTINNCEVILTENGQCPEHHVPMVGSIQSAIVSTMVNDRLKPRVKLNPGTAGGYGGAAVRDVIVGTRSISCDHRIELKGHDECAPGHSSSILDLKFVIDEIIADAQKLGISIREGISVKHSSLLTSAADTNELNKIRDRYKLPMSVDMEIAGVVDSARCFNILVFPIKGIVNEVSDKPAVADDLVKNHEEVCIKLAKVVRLVIEKIAGKRLDEVGRNQPLQTTDVQKKAVVAQPKVHADPVSFGRAALMPKANRPGVSYPNGGSSAQLSQTTSTTATPPRSRL